MPFADVALIIGDTLLDGFEDFFVVFVEGNNPVLSGNDGNLLPARGVFFDADAYRSGNGQEFFAMLFEFRARGDGQDVFLSQHRDVKKCSDDVDNLGIGDALDLNPDHARFTGIATDGIQFGKLLQLATGLIIGNDPKLGRGGRLKRRGGWQLARGAADFRLRIGGFAGQRDGIGL